MIPLIKIRATYLKRKKLKVFFSYCMIPLMVIIAAIYYSSMGESKDYEINEKQKFVYNFDSEYYLFKDSNFTDIYLYLSNTSLIVNNADLGNKLVDYIEEQTKLKLQLYSDENQLNNHSQNILILNYDEDKDSYKFSYKEKEISQMDYLKRFFPFDSSLLSTQKSLDVFTYEYDDKYEKTDTSNKRFLVYQAFLSKFLIEKIKNKKINRDIHFNFGLNSYPPAVKNPNDFSTIEPLISYLITMQFTFVFLSFSIQMLEEKEQKLEKLLERQGISFSKYLGSWLINFLIVTILTNISLIFGGFLILQSFWGLYELYIILK